MGYMAKATTDGSGRYLFGGFNDYPSILEGDVDDRDGIANVNWNRDMREIGECSLMEASREKEFQILAKKLLRMGRPPQAMCLKRKGYGCRSLLIGTEESMLTGGLFLQRQITREALHRKSRRKL